MGFEVAFPWIVSISFLLIVHCNEHLSTYQNNGGGYFYHHHHYYYLFSHQKGPAAAASGVVGQEIGMLW
jgi:hypothetical protein